ncbi:MAG: substrate-binding domain-containing protein [Promicromonosporaceae bacterium]|nr:substrate-binding domain-containing protein [Promicromonosporaceae bacterium]
MSQGPTIAEIARAVGVSAPTVSKVINGRADVAEGTRSRIEAALATAGYQRRRATTVGGKSETGLIDLVFHRIGSPWATELINGVLSTAAQHQVSVILTELGGLSVPSDSWVDTALARPPLGALMVSSHLEAHQFERLKRRNVPVVVIDTDGEPPTDVASVGSDNWNGGLLAARHLIGLGHRRIGLVGGPENMLTMRARLDGFRSAHAEAGLAYRPELFRPGNFFVGTGYSAGHDLLTLPASKRPTAIFAGADVQALGVLRAANELGIRVPEDLSIVGYDDVPEATWVSPMLTTVTQKLPAMAMMATELLLDLAAGRKPVTTRINLTTELIVRESTASPA